MKITATNLRGVKIPDRGAGSFLTTWRRVIIGAVNSFLNLRVVLKRADGTAFDAEIKQTYAGTIVTIPLKETQAQQTIAFKVCREDGTTVYAVIPVAAVYTLPADSPDTAEIYSGKVPDGTIEIL